MRINNKIAGLMALGAWALLPQAGHTLSADTYTIYYADERGWQPENTLVHVWNRTYGNPDAPYKEWDDNEAMTATGEYLRLDGRYIPVYSYEFEWELEPSCVIIHSSATMGAIQQSKDYPFVDGAMYRFVAIGDNSSDGFIDNPVIIDKEDLPKTTVYFADTGNWGPENTQIHIWGSNGDFSEYFSDPTMTDTGKYALVNDVWARVYQYNYFYDGVVEGVMFHLKDKDFATSDLTEVDGAMYFYTGNKKPSRVIDAPEMVDAIPTDSPRPVSLYVNLGANQMMETGLWDEPCAHIYRRDAFTGSYESLLPEYGSDAYKAEVMTKIRDGFYRIDIDDIGDCNDVVFYYSKINAQGEQTYQDLVFPASRGLYNDPSTWATFIYDIGLDCVHQSYITPYEYNAAWEESPAALFLTGNELVLGMNVDDPASCVPIESDDDVYIHKFTISEGDIATFKLSRFDVYGAAVRHGFSMEDKSYETQRGWATFNLGIIGFQNDPEDADWYNRYVYAPGNGESRQVRIWLNESVDFNSSTQYPWRLGDGENGVTEGDYWLVIDLHDDDHSLTLLDFDPNPTAEIANNGFSVAEVGYDYALGLDNPDPHKGEAANGKVGFDRMNVLSAKAEVTGRSTDFLKERDFTVAYIAYVGDVAVATLDLPEDGGFESAVMEIPYMAPGEAADVSVRAHYTDINTRRSFCSRKNHRELTAPTPELPAPASVTADGAMFLYFASPEQLEELVMTVGGASTIPYSLEEPTGHAFYPDYSVDEVETDGVAAPTDNTLVSASHFVAGREQFANHLGKYSETPWMPWSEETDYDDTHNWSKYIAEEGHLPLFVNSLTTVDRLDATVTATASVTLHAVYPFLVASDKNAAASAPIRVRARAAEGEDAPATLPDGLSMVTMRRSAAATVEFGGRTISSIDGINADQSMTDEAERYYTIGGVALSSRPSVPGVYVAVKGTDVKKVIIK